MKKIGLLIPTALCAVVPVVCAASCSKGSPTVQYKGQSDVLVTAHDTPITLEFEMNNELGEWTLKTEMRTSVSSDKSWINHLPNETKVEGKKITLKVVAPSTFTGEHPSIEATFNFIFSGPKGNETRSVGGISFMYSVR